MYFLAAVAIVLLILILSCLSSAWGMIYDIEISARRGEESLKQIVVELKRLNNLQE